MRRLILSLLIASATSVFADFTVVLDAGRLRIDAANAMAQGSLLLLVAAGGDSTFSTSLTAGNYTAGNDYILGAAPFNTSGGPDETNNVFSISTPATTGDLIGLLWFPNISYAQYQTGTVPTGGQNYGFYNPLYYGNSTNNPDGGNPWAVPAPGGAINLNFYTTDSFGSGTQAPAEGYASFTVLPVPEPSTAVFLVSALALGSVEFVRRRRARR